mmetsp:Transcript_112177/g.358007  ORF Transcript_112177/g.358007 Transcript_112177/m.358007 type:complete len:205 (-) Transcript_112177:229-843(-)
MATPPLLRGDARVDGGQEGVELVVADGRPGHPAQKMSASEAVAVCLHQHGATVAGAVLDLEVGRAVAYAQGRRRLDRVQSDGLLPRAGRDRHEKEREHHERCTAKGPPVILRHGDNRDDTVSHHHIHGVLLALDEVLHEHGAAAGALRTRREEAADGGLRLLGAGPVVQEGHVYPPHAEERLHDDPGRLLRLRESAHLRRGVRA